MKLYCEPLTDVKYLILGYEELDYEQKFTVEINFCYTDEYGYLYATYDFDTYYIINL